MAELDHRLAQIAAGQHSLVTLRDVERAGGTRHHLLTRVEIGHLERLERGVYGIAGVAPHPDRSMRATILATRGVVAVSHLAAARRYEIPGYARAPVELTIERGVRLRRQGMRIHESTDLDRCRIIEVDGIPTTEPARTLLDLARLVGPQRLLRNIEHCRRVGLLDWDDLLLTLVRHARRGRPGIRRLREAIASNSHRPTVTDSDLELLVVALLVEHGLPEPVLHHQVWDGDRFVAELDLAYPERRIAMECDGDVHLDHEVHERDLPRQNDLVLLGWTVLRFTPERYWQRPSRIVDEVRTAYAQPLPQRTCDITTHQS